MNRIAKFGRDERGVTGVLFALMMVVIISFVGVAVDVGNLFLHKTRLQNAADASVLSAITDLDNRNSIVRGVVEHSNIVPDDLKEMRITLGTWDEAVRTFIPDASGEALEVKLDEELPIYFLRILGMQSPQPVSAKATGILRQAGAVVKLGATAIDINTDEGTLLKGLLGSLLGTSLHLSAIGWQGLVNAHLDLVKFINLAKLELNIGTTEGLLDVKLSIGEILDLMVEALQADEATAAVALNILKNQVLHTSIAPINTELRLGDLLEVDLNRGALAKADVNALSMVTALAELFNHESAVSLDTNIDLGGLLNVDLKVKVSEPPVIKIMQEGSTIHGAGARVYLNAEALGGLGSAGNALLKVPLYLELGSGDAELTDISPDGVELATVSSLAKLYIGDINENFFFSDSTLGSADFDPVRVLDLLGLITVDLKAHTDAAGGAGAMTVSPEEFGQTISAYNPAGSGVGGLVDNLLSSENLEINLGLLGLDLGLGTLVKPLLDSVILTPLLAALLNPISALTGVSLGRTDVTVYDYAYEAVLVD